MKYDKTTNVVTGAFGFTGRYITELLLEKGVTVRTLTNHPNRPNPFGSSVEVYPYNFDNPSLMVEALRGVDTLYNTYWVRFNYGKTSYGQAVANVENLFHAAKEAGVRKVVHISIAHPADGVGARDYYTGKSAMEETLKRSGLEYAILRPTLIFGSEDILINNIAYFLRNFPMFTVPGDGTYRVQPVFVKDVAALAVDAAGKKENITLDAVGPETYSFINLVRLLKDMVGSRAFVLKAPARIAHLFSKALDPVVNDVVLTWGEVTRLMEERLCVSTPPLCKTRFSVWIRDNADSVGRTYASELKRHFV